MLWIRPAGFHLSFIIFSSPMQIPIIMPQLGESIAEATIVSFLVKPGDQLEKGQEVGRIADSLGRSDRRVKAALAGVVIGLNLNPLVHRGDALLNVGLREARPSTRVKAPRTP